MQALHYLDSTSYTFPPTHQAALAPNGLLAMGGDLSVRRLLAAYSKGIFPWYNQEEAQPILWWTPNPRCVLYPSELHISRSLRKYLNKHPFTYSVNRAFAEVVNACRQPRASQEGTWIGDAMSKAYSELHSRGYAHSLEVWQQGQLVGGLYGVVLGKVFFGESMFSHCSNASKAGLVYLCQYLQQRSFELIDCQVESSHLLSMGARTIAREEFESLLRTHIDAQYDKLSEF